MSIQLYSPTEPLTLVTKDVLYYALAVKTDDPTMIALANEAASQCLKIAVPRLVYRYFSICAKEETGVLLDNGYYLEGNLVCKYLSDCVGIYMVVATVGMAVDRYIRLSGMTSTTKALFAEAAGSAAVESLLDAFAATLDKRQMCKPRISPGYGDFSLENQKTIFKWMDATKMLGVCLNDSLLISPSKSVSAIIGCRKDISCLT